MSAPDPVFDALVSAGPIVDMIGDSRMEYDGPRCAADDCTTAVEDDGDRCDDCAPCSSCHGNGGWQQPDGLIVECPRGCMAGDDGWHPCPDCGCQCSPAEWACWRCGAVQDDAQLEDGAA